MVCPGLDSMTGFPELSFSLSSLLCLPQLVGRCACRGSRCFPLAPCLVVCDFERLWLCISRKRLRTFGSECPPTRAVPHPWDRSCCVSPVLVCPGGVVTTKAQRWLSFFVPRESLAIFVIYCVIFNLGNGRLIQVLTGTVQFLGTSPFLLSTASESWCW